MRLWMSRFIRSQGGRSVEGTNGVRLTRIPSVGTTMWSGFCKVRTMPRHTSCEMLQIIVRRSCEGRRQVDIARITGVTQGEISKSLKSAWQTGFPKQSSLSHRQRISALDLLQHYWLLVLKHILLTPTHDPIVLLLSAQHLMTCNVTRKLIPAHAQPAIWRIS